MVSLTTPVEKLASAVYVTVQVPEEPAVTSVAGNMTAVPLPGCACAAVEKRMAGTRHATSRSPFRILPPGSCAGLPVETLCIDPDMIHRYRGKVYATFRTG